MNMDWLDKDAVEILGGDSGRRGLYLKYVFDADSSSYLAPQLSPAQEAFRELALKEAIRQGYLQQLGASEEEFEASWPERWKQLNTPSDESLDRVFAILDTGLLYEHPLLQGRILDGVNLSTEKDLSDHSGHGTMVALLLRVGLLPYVPRFLNVKVANASGIGKPRDLIAGLRWIVNYQRAHPHQVITANLSTGTYSKRWLAFDCRGNCTVCEAAVEAAEAGVTIVAAAGNTPEKTACPAMAGLYRRHERISAVAQLGWEQSGIGNVAVPGGAVWMPVK